MKGCERTTSLRVSFSLLPYFLLWVEMVTDFFSERSGKKSISVTGSTLSLPLINFTARFPELAGPSFSTSSDNCAINTTQENVERIERSRKIIDDKLKNKASIYGVSTGFGGSAVTRTDAYSELGYALLQHQHAGVLPTDLGKSPEERKESVPLPMSTPLSTPSHLC